MAWTEQLPSGKFRGIYRLADGRRRSVGTFIQKRQALNAASSAEADAASPKWRDPRAALRTWGEWCDDWWETRDIEPGTLHRDVSSRDSCLMTRWRDVALSSINRHDIQAWAVSLKRGGMAPRTVQKRVYLLSSSLKGAVDAGVLNYNPAARINVVKGVTDSRRYLSAEETDRLLAQFRPPVANPLNDAIVSTLLWTGLRWGEMAGLQIERVLFGRGLIDVQEVWDNDMRRLKAYPKGRKRRFVPIADSLIPLLKYAIGKRATGHVFLVGGKHVLEYSNWRQRFWIGATSRSGLTGVRIHDLRHTYASTMLQNGVPLEEVGKLLGHVSMQTTMIYAHLSETPDDRVLSALTRMTRGAGMGQDPTAPPSTKLQDG